MHGHGARSAARGSAPEPNRSDFETPRPIGTDASGGAGRPRRDRGVEASR